MVAVVVAAAEPFVPVGLAAACFGAKGIDSVLLGVHVVKETMVVALVRLVLPLAALAYDPAME